MSVRVALLGERSITGGPPAGPRAVSPRAIELVCFLVLHAGTAQARARIAGLFWPDSSDAQALTNLRRELHSLRRAVGDEPCLVVTARDLCWAVADGVSVDVLDFGVDEDLAWQASRRSDAEATLRHADSALARYAGELLPGVYDDWVVDAREDLQRRCVQLCGLVCRTRMSVGDPAGALHAARRRIRLEPLDEEGYRILMEIQAEMGDRGGAVSTYHRCASILERELHVTPGPDTRAALERFMPRRPGSSAAGPLPRPPAGSAGAGAVPLVGRADIMDRLVDACRRALAGRPGVAVVSGDAGVGKTRLLRELARLAGGEGAVVAHSQCFGSSGRLALAPVADWLRNPAVRSATSGLDPLWRDEVERLVPSPGARRDGRQGSRAMVDAWQRHRFFEGLARAVLATGRPTVLVLDNVHWCDEETLAFVTFLLVHASGAGLLVAATARHDGTDAAPGLGHWLDGLRTARMLTEASIGPLERDDTARLAEAIRGSRLSEEEGTLIQAVTGGFPLHIVEAMRVATAHGSAPIPAGGLAGVLRSRLEQAGGNAQEVVGLAAAVGRDFSLELLAEASDLEPDRVVDAVDELWRARILHGVEDRYDFSHDLLREAAYERVTPARRWLLHRRLAQGLELLHADDTDPVAAELAEQYVRGGRPEKAVAYYRRAAEIASGIFAHAEAARLLAAAAAIVASQPRTRERDRRELALLEARAAPLNAWQGYASEDLHRVLLRSVELAESLGQTDSVVLGLVGLWTSLFVRGDMAACYDAATRGFALVRPESELAGAVHFAVGGALLCMGDAAASVAHFRAAAERVHGAMLTVGTRPDVHSLGFESHAHWMLGDDAAAVTCLEDSVAKARAGDHPYSLAVALAYAAITRQLRSENEELAAVVAELRDLCDRYGFGYYREWGLVLDGWARGGRAGLLLAQRGIGNLRAEASFARMPYWLSLLADLQAREGMADGARSSLDAAIVSANVRGELWWLPEVQRLRARFDEPAAAAARLGAALELASGQGSTALVRRCEASLAALRPAHG